MDLTERDIKSPRKRSAHENLSLVATIEEIIQHYEEEKNNEAAKTMQAIQRLKELSSA